MKHLLIVITMLSLAAGMAMAVPQAAKAGKYSVSLAIHPEQPVVGENHVVLTVTEAGKPVTGADVVLHVDMAGMPMPADVRMTPGSENGQYTATVNLGMAGDWTLTATVHAMAGMAMAGDGKVMFTVAAQPATGGAAGTPVKPASLPWPLVAGAFLVVGVVIAFVIARGRSRQRSGA